MCRRKIDVEGSNGEEGKEEGRAKVSFGDEVESSSLPSPFSSSLS